MVEPGGIPANLLIVYAGNGQLEVTGRSDSYGIIYAPNASAVLSGQGSWSGALVLSTLVYSGGGAIHYDRSLGH